MSSWLSSIFRSPSIIREEGCEEYEDQSSNINDKFFVQPDLPSLTNEQREHIIKVMQRAEQSSQSAKIVMDSKRLKTVKSENLAQHISGSNDIIPNDFIQMDAIPDDVEVTIGPYSYCSYANSEISYSGSEQIERDLEEYSDTLEASDSVQLDVEQNEVNDEQTSIRRSMKLLGQKISNWIKSLDEEDDYVTPRQRRKSFPSVTKKFDIGSSSLCPASVAYCGFISKEICATVMRSIEDSERIVLQQQSVNHVEAHLEKLIQLIISDAIKKHQKEQLEFFYNSLMQTVLEEALRTYIDFEKRQILFSIQRPLIKSTTLDLLTPTKKRIRLFSRSCPNFVTKFSTARSVFDQSSVSDDLNEPTYTYLLESDLTLHDESQLTHLEENIAECSDPSPRLFQPFQTLADENSSETSGADEIESANGSLSDECPRAITLHGENSSGTSGADVAESKWSSSNSSINEVAELPNRNNNYQINALPSYEQSNYGYFIAFDNGVNNAQLESHITDQIEDANHQNFDTICTHQKNEISLNYDGAKLTERQQDISIIDDPFNDGNVRALSTGIDSPHLMPKINSNSDTEETDRNQNGNFESFVAENNENIFVIDQKLTDQERKRIELIKELAYLDSFNPEDYNLSPTNYMFKDETLDISSNLCLKRIQETYCANPVSNTLNGPLKEKFRDSEIEDTNIPSIMVKSCSDNHLDDELYAEEMFYAADSTSGICSKPEAPILDAVEASSSIKPEPDPISNDYFLEEESRDYEKINQPPSRPPPPKLQTKPHTESHHLLSNPRIEITCPTPVEQEQNYDYESDESNPVEKQNQLNQNDLINGVNTFLPTENTQALTDQKTIVHVFESFDSNTSEQSNETSGPDMESVEEEGEIGQQKEFESLIEKSHEKDEVDSSESSKTSAADAVSSSSDRDRIHEFSYQIEYGKTADPTFFQPLMNSQYETLFGIKEINEGVNDIEATAVGDIEAPFLTDPTSVSTLNELKKRKQIDDNLKLEAELLELGLHHRLPICQPTLDDKSFLGGKLSRELNEFEKNLFELGLIHRFSEHMEEENEEKDNLEAVSSDSEKSFIDSESESESESKHKSKMEARNALNNDFDEHITHEKAEIFISKESPTFKTTDIDEKSEHLVENKDKNKAVSHQFQTSILTKDEIEHITRIQMLADEMFLTFADDQTPTSSLVQSEPSKNVKSLEEFNQTRVDNKVGDEILYEEGPSNTIITKSYKLPSIDEHFAMSLHQESSNTSLCSNSSTDSLSSEFHSEFVQDEFDVMVVNVMIEKSKELNICLCQTSNLEVSRKTLKFEEETTAIGWQEGRSSDPKLSDFEFDLRLIKSDSDELIREIKEGSSSTPTSTYDRHDSENFYTSSEQTSEADTSINSGASLNNFETDISKQKEVDTSFQSNISMHLHDTSGASDERLTKDELEYIENICRVAEESMLAELSLTIDKETDNYNYNKNCLELTEDELEHIKKVEERARESLLEVTVEPRTESTENAEYIIAKNSEKMVPSIISETGSSETSGADNISSYESPDHYEPAQSSIISKASEPCASNAIYGSLTEEEVEHIEHIRRMAEQSSFDETFQWNQLKPEINIEVDIALTFQQQSEGAKEFTNKLNKVTVLADTFSIREIDRNTTFDEINEENAHRNSSSSIPSIYVTNDKYVEHMSDDEMSRSLTDIASNASDSILHDEPRVLFDADTTYQLSNENHHTVEEQLNYVSIPEKKSESEKSLNLSTCKILVQDAINDARKKRSSLVHTTTIAYTNKFTQNMKRWTSVSDYSPHLDAELDISTPFRSTMSDYDAHTPTFRSNINILFTNKLGDSFRHSFTDEFEISPDSNDAKHEVDEERTLSITNELPMHPPSGFESEELVDDLEYDSAFYMKLNFFVQRLIETIAEEAVNDIRNIIHLKQNPRAAYFDDRYNIFFDQEEDAEQKWDTDEEDLYSKGNENIHEETRNFEVFDLQRTDQRETDSSSRLLSSFLSGKYSPIDRSRSALAHLFQSARKSSLLTSLDFGRKSSLAEVQHSEKRRKSGDVNELLIRPSTADQAVHSRSLLKLPEEAFTNISLEEREHILSIIAASTKKHVKNFGSPDEEYRSPLVPLNQPALNNLSLSEKEHIETVIHKAEQRDTLFAIPHSSQFPIFRSLSTEQEQTSNAAKFYSLDTEHHLKDECFEPVTENLTEMSKLESDAVEKSELLEIAKLAEDMCKNTFEILEPIEEIPQSQMISEDEFQHIAQVVKLAELELASNQKFICPTSPKIGSKEEKRFKIPSIFAKAKNVAEKISIVKEGINLGGSKVDKTNEKHEFIGDIVQNYKLFQMDEQIEKEIVLNTIEYSKLCDQPIESFALPLQTDYNSSGSSCSSSTSSADTDEEIDEIDEMHEHLVAEAPTLVNEANQEIDARDVKAQEHIEPYVLSTTEDNILSKNHQPRTEFSIMTSITKQFQDYKGKLKAGFKETKQTLRNEDWEMEQKIGLSAEEIEHIRKVTEMADANFYNLSPSDRIEKIDETNRIVITSVTSLVNEDAVPIDQQKVKETLQDEMVKKHRPISPEFWSSSQDSGKTDIQDSTDDSGISEMVCFSFSSPEGSRKESLHESIDSSIAIDEITSPVSKEFKEIEKELQRMNEALKNDECFDNDNEIAANFAREEERQETMTSEFYANKVGYMKVRRKDEYGDGVVVGKNLDRDTSDINSQNRCTMNYTLENQLHMIQPLKDRISDGFSASPSEANKLQNKAIGGDSKENTRVVAGIEDTILTLTDGTLPIQSSSVVFPAISRPVDASISLSNLEGLPGSPASIVEDKERETERDSVLASPIDIQPLRQVPTQPDDSFSTNSFHNLLPKFPPLIEEHANLQELLAETNETANFTESTSNLVANQSILDYSSTLVSNNSSGSSNSSSTSLADSRDLDDVDGSTQNETEFDASMFSKNTLTNKSFGGFGDKFLKLASNTLKGAKQASEQLGAMTQAKSTLNLAKEFKMSISPKSGQQALPRAQSALEILPSDTANNYQPPLHLPHESGEMFAGLSEEERIKIMAVMQCAELDMENDAEREELRVGTFQSTSEPVPDESHQRNKLSANSSIDLSGLSEEEQRQIRAVMLLAEEEGIVKPDKAAEDFIGEMIVRNNNKIDDESVVMGKTAGFKLADTLPETKEVTKMHEAIELHLENVNDLMSPNNVHEDFVAIKVQPIEEETFVESASKQFLVESREYVTGTETFSVPIEDSSASHHTSPTYNQLEEEEDIWMQPPRKEKWSSELTFGSNSRKLWTTVFTEETNESSSEQKIENDEQFLDDYAEEDKMFKPGEEQPLESISAETVRGCWELPMQETFKPSILSDGNASSNKYRKDISDEQDIANNSSYEIEMEDPWSPTFGLIRTENEEDKQKRMMMAPPEILVTNEEDNEIERHKEEEDSEDGEAATSSSDEDDYPDQVIKAPIESSRLTSLDDEEQRESDQQKLARDVFRQIEAFGEAANNEFDIQWGTSTAEDKTKIEQRPEESKLEELKQEYFMDDAANVFDDSSFSVKSDAVKTMKTRVTNPFLESPEGGWKEEEDMELQESDDHIIVREDEIDVRDREDSSHQELGNYYKTQPINSYFVRPGPVYTIPELEDENISGLSSREGIYHAREFERKPLHGQSIPPLIPQEDSYKKSQRKATKEDEGNKTLISYYPDSKTATSSYSAIVTSENFPTEAPPTVADKSDDASPQQPLTPVRTAPPPPPERSKENAINEPRSDQSFNVLTSQENIMSSSSSVVSISHPFTAAIHLQKQLDQMISNQSRFQSDITQPEDLVPIHYDSIDNNLSNNLTLSSPARHGLKRSPAMILTSGQKRHSLASTDHKETDLICAKKPFSFGTETQKIFANTQKGRSDEDVPRSNSSDMGRRRLPSLPIAASASTYAKPSPRHDSSVLHGTYHPTAPIYYTSCPPESRNEATSPSIFSTHTPRYYHPSDFSTTIFPGAHFRPSDSSHNEQNYLINVSKQLNKIITSTSATRSKPPSAPMTAADKANAETLYQLRFKKELREVLEQRKIALESCEIEAGHRQYMINRMLTSGLMPLSKPIELEAIPKIVKCSLPVELIEGVQITPLRSKNKKWEIKSQNMGEEKELNESKNLLVLSKGVTEPIKTSKGCQVDLKYGEEQEEPLMKDFHQLVSKIHHASSVPKMVDSSTQTPLAAETQTDKIPQSPPTYSHQSTSTKKFRKTRVSKFGDRYFKDSGTSSDESRRQRVQRELDERHRELNFSSLVDLREYADSSPLAIKRQYRDASFPFISYNDVCLPYDQGNKYEEKATQTELKNCEYGRNQLSGSTYQSLPRNYERWTPSQGKETKRAYYVNRQASRDSDFYSRSMLDLRPNASYIDGPSKELISLPPFGRQFNKFYQTPSRVSRSDNYIDRFLSDNYPFSNKYDDSYSKTPEWPSNCKNFFPDYQERNMVSEYANYLNQVFDLGKRGNYSQGEETDDTYFKNFYPREHCCQTITNSVAPPQFNPYSSTINNNYIDAIANDNGRYGNIRDVQCPGVYSRNEVNYGCRPQREFVSDYGNGMRERTTLYEDINRNVHFDLIKDAMDYEPDFYKAHLPQMKPVNQQHNFNNNIKARNYDIPPQHHTPSERFQLPPSILRRQDTIHKRVDSVWPEELERGEQRSQFHDYMRRNKMNNNKYLKDLSSHENYQDKFENRQRRNDNGILLSGDCISNERNGGNSSHTRPIKLACENDGQRHNNDRKTKRILLTRRYKHQNVFEDIGIQLKVGNQLPNGEHPAIISFVDSRLLNATNGEVQKGDQLLTWNGAMMSNKTFSEIEQIADASTGEIELVIRTCSQQSCAEADEKENIRKDQQLSTRSKNESFSTKCDIGVYDDCEYHQKRNPRHIPRYKGTTSIKEPQFSGIKRNQRFSEDQIICNLRNSISPPPIPAHKMSTGENNDVKLTPMGDKNCDVYNDDSSQDSIKNIGGHYGYIQLAFSYSSFGTILLIDVIAARNLLCRPSNYGDIKPNPCVSVHLFCDDRTIATKKVHHQTATINPRWEYEINFVVGRNQLRNFSVEFIVKDYGGNGDDFALLGRAVIHLSEPSLFNNKPRWYPLHSPHRKIRRTKCPARHSRAKNNLRFDYNPVNLDIDNETVRYPVIA